MLEAAQLIVTFTYMYICAVNLFVISLAIPNYYANIRISFFERTGSMPNRNIYFSDEQVAEMKKFSQENWSAVCQQAVDTRLRYLAIKSSHSTDAIERAKARLAVEKAAFVVDIKERGERAGCEWAADTASFVELSRLHFAMCGEHPAIDFPTEDSEIIAVTLARIIYGEPAYRWHDDTISAEDGRLAIDLSHAAGLSPESLEIESARFWEGFVSGAASIYEQV